MADKLPTIVVLKQFDGSSYVSYLTSKYDKPRVSWQGKSVFDPLSKIEIERSKTKPDELVNLRFVHTNQYWLGWSDAIHGINIEQHFSMYAFSGKPDEDASSKSCTLFKPKVVGDKLYLIHVFTNLPLMAFPTIRTDRLGDGTLSDEHAFRWVNVEQLVRLPKFVAFKGNNNKFLKSVADHYLEFSSEDPNRKDSAYEVQETDAGDINIKSLYFDKFWWVGSTTWVRSIHGGKKDNDKATFKPIKVGEKIVLQNLSNGLFCQNVDNSLNANIDSMTNDTRMEVVNLVTGSQLNNIRFKTEFSRVYGEEPYVMGRTTALNDSDVEMSVAVKLSKLEKTSKTFTKGVAVAGGLKQTLNLGPDIVKLGTTEVSITVTGTFTSGDTKEESTTYECTASVSVPKRSRAILDCVGTKGRTSVPYSYKQEDHSSFDGKFVAEDHIDGIFTAVSFYGFEFKLVKIEPL